MPGAFLPQANPLLQEATRNQTRKQHPQCPGYVSERKNPFQTRSKPGRLGEDEAGGSDRAPGDSHRAPRLPQVPAPGGGRGHPPRPPPTFQALLRVGAQPPAPQLLVQEPDDGVGQALLLRHPGGRSVPPRGSHPAGNGAA